MIDFSGETKADAKPRLRQILEFLSGCSDQDLFRVVYDDPGECLSVDVTVRKAREAVEQGDMWQSYDIFSNNCESFATFMKTGRKVSAQAIQALKGVIGIGYDLSCKIGGSLGGTNNAAEKGGSIGGSLRYASMRYEKPD